MHPRSESPSSSPSSAAPVSREGAVLPWRVSFYTLGCRVNAYETQAMEERFRAAGFAVVPFGAPCDVCVVNTCAVTAESEKKSRKMIRRAKSENPDAFVIVMGCASQVHADIIEKIPGVDYVCGNRNKLSVIEAAKSLIENGKIEQNVKIEDVERAPIEKMNITRSDRTRAYVKIEDGCDNHCTYCIIKKARGNVVSRTASDVINEINDLVLSGYKEVVLTGVEVASYGRDFSDGYKLPDLVRDISEKTGIERIRLSSLEPSILRADFVDMLSENKKFMPSFHLSLQSGSNAVLASMKRKYNRESVIKNTDYIKAKMPDATFTCDIITGFPGETEEDFAMTSDIAKHIHFLHMHVFPFSKRDGTPAAEMDNQLSEDVKNERARELIDLDVLMKEEVIRAFSGKIYPVLFETHENGFYMGHTPNMIEVKVVSDEDLCGKIVNVKLTGYEDGTATGNVAEEKI